MTNILGRQMIRPKTLLKAPFEKIRKTKDILVNKLNQSSIYYVLTKLKNKTIPMFI